MARAEARAFVSLERQPGADEFVDLDAHAEQSGKQAAQARGALHPRREQARIFHLGEIGQRIGVAERRRADADHRTDIGAKPILAGPVVLRDRARVGPGAKEQRDEPALKNVGETRKSVVALQQPTIALFGGRQRQRALRPEHAEEARDKAHPPRGLHYRVFEIGGGKLHVRVLRDDEIFLGELRGVADARLVGVLTLEAPQRRQHVEAPGLGDEFVAKSHETPLRPRRGGQRMISPRSLVRTTTWVK